MSKSYWGHWACPSRTFKKEVMLLSAILPKFPTQCRSFPTQRITSYISIIFLLWLRYVCDSQPDFIRPKSWFFVAIQDFILAECHIDTRTDGGHSRGYMLMMNDLLYQTRTDIKAEVRGEPSTTWKPLSSIKASLKGGIHGICLLETAYSGLRHIGYGSRMPQGLYFNSWQDLMSMHPITNSIRSNIQQL